MNFINTIKNDAVIFLVVLSAIIFSCNTLPSKHNKYYVSLDGKDSNSGTIVSPFRTIKKGASVLNSGDTLIVKDGDYGYEFAIKIDKNGQKDNPIVIMAENPGKVFLKGLRKEGEVDGADSLKDGDTGTAFVIANVSYVVIDGFIISNYRAAIDVGIWDDAALKIEKPLKKAHNVVVKNCTLDKNGKDGIQVFRVDSVLVSNCIFISDYIMEEEHGETYPNAIQDYGVNFYSSTASIVEDCYFYGAHNQALSFKEGDVDCIARRNIFEGAPLYTGIYLGQNKIADNTEENKNPSCKNLIAEYNIVRGAKGFRVKSPIRVDNVINAIVRNNYFEGFDETHKTGGISVFDEAKGKIEIYNNILAFGADKDSSFGIYIMDKLDPKTKLLIHNNILYNLAKDIHGELKNRDRYKKNIVYKMAHLSKKYKNNFYGNPKFIENNPKQLPITVSPVKPDFDQYYFKLTKAFILSKNSPAKGYGASPLLK